MKGDCVSWSNATQIGPFTSSRLVSCETSLARNAAERISFQTISVYESAVTPITLFVAPITLFALVNALA